MAAMTAQLTQQLHDAAAPGFNHLSQLHSMAMAAQQSQAQQQGAGSLDGGGSPGGAGAGDTGQGANEPQPA